MKWMWIIPALIICGIPSVCQQADLLEELALQIVENGNTEDAEQLHEWITELMRNPLNINSCSKSKLNGSGLLTPFQVHGILKYRDAYGPFFSIYELAAIPGFRREFLENITPLIAFTDDDGPGKNIHHRGYLLTNLSDRFPHSAAYLRNDTVSPHYAGQPFKFTSRLKYEAGTQWVFAASFDKDPGEQWTNRKSPEHLSGYIQYRPEKILNNLVLGNFRIHRGMGLVHGTGFSAGTAGTTGIAMNGYRRSYVKAFASTMEYDYYRGLYAAAETDKWSVDLFFSERPEDISLFRIENGADLYEQVRKTGLHRTSPERDGYNLAREQAAGCSVNWSSDQGYLGVAGTRSQLQLTEGGVDSVRLLGPLVVPDTGRSNLSLYGVYFGNGLELFGEAAIDHQYRIACTGGATYELNVATMLSLSVRRYQPGFTGQTPKASGTGSEPENESGMNCGMVITPFSQARMFLNTDISRSILTAAGTPPGFRFRSNVRFVYNPVEEAEMLIVYSNRSGPVLLTGATPGNGYYSNESLNRYRFHATYNLSEKTRLSARIECSVMQSGGDRHNGKTGYAQFKTSPKKGTTMLYRLLLFDSEYWDNRIYTYEPGVRYSFLFPAWHGRGTRNVVVTSLKPWRWLTIRGKLGLTNYAHRRETGTGHDTRKGNRILDAELQVQIDL